ncbi:hypothetical protein Tco_0577883 [Tanacetum coccineum]
MKNLSFEEVKEQFDKLVEQVESFVPINFKATKDSLKRFDEELQTKTSKRLKSGEAKDDESTKKTEKKRKQIASKGLHSDKNLEIQMKSMKKMIILQIVRENGTDMVYISFRAMLTDISRDDLTELYRIVMRKHDVYMLIERKYPLSTEMCKAMLDKKLQGGKPYEDCYKLLKMIEKQDGIRK